MADTRQRNRNWRCADNDGKISYEQATLATLMDIRDELQAIHCLAACYRIPLALDALIEIGKDQRRKKRNAAARAKLKRSASKEK